MVVRFYIDTLERAEHPVKAGVMLWAPSMFFTPEYQNQPGTRLTPLTDPPSLVDGSHSINWCLVRVDAADHTALAALPSVFILPQGLNNTVSTMSSAQRTALRTKLQGLGLTTTETANARTLREVIHAVGRRLLQNTAFEAVE